MKKAFTLIELIFVIVITALIGVFGANLFVVLNDNYLRSKAINSLSYEIDNAFNIIEAKLSSKIYTTVISRHKEATKGPKIDYDNYKYLRDDEVTSDYFALEWISKSIESRNVGDKRPGWSGIMDIKAPYVKPTQSDGGGGTFISPASKLTFARDVMESLYKDSSKTAALIFAINKNETGNHDEFGFGNKNKSVQIAVVDLKDAKTKDEVFSVKKYELGKTYGELYDLAHTAYTVFPTDVKNASDSSVVDYFDLILYYNYQPWNGMHFKDGKSSLLAEYVTQFRYKYLGKVGEATTSQALIMKICMVDGGRTMGTTSDIITQRAKNLANVEICKTRLVY